MQGTVASGISHPFRQLSQSEGQITHVLLTRSPLEYPPKEAFPLDLHVLSTPPAFVLSQDQTLHRKQNPHPPKHRQDKSSKRKTISKPKNETTSKQSPESSFVNSKKPNHHNKNHDGQRFQHTNQFIDKHTVEFSKIRRATTPPG